MTSAMLCASCCQPSSESKLSVPSMGQLFTPGMMRTLGMRCRNSVKTQGRSGLG